MNYPLLLCIFSILLAASGGLNVGFAFGLMQTALGYFFVIMGFVGISLSFFELRKGDEILEEENDNQVQR